VDASIRTFKTDDIRFALEQTRREGWDATAELFQAALAHDPDGCFVAEADGCRVGMVTTTAYSQSGWIGNLIVPPECRRRGIGELLMKYAMGHLTGRGLKTMRLEADPPGIGIYRRLGFVDEFESLRFRLTVESRETRVLARRIEAADLPTIAAFDAEYFGDDRGRLLALLYRDSKTAYWLQEGRGATGYAFATSSSEGVHLRPWVAKDRRAAETLLQSILAEWPSATAILGVPSVNSRAVELLESCGFERAPSCRRMVFGERAGAGRPENVFAIANGAMG
jgi:ribosomal protein S18 acetylase RimI-like enzyme